MILVNQQQSSHTQIYRSNVKTYKKDLPFDEFIKEKKTKKLLNSDPEIIIGHCRYPTQGEEKYEFNNHPFVYKNLVLVHKGHIWNDKELKRKYDLSKQGDTDSWVIIQLISYFQQQGNTLIRSIAKIHYELRGKWACAIIDRNDPEKVYLFSDDDSFKVVYLIDKKQFAFSTEEKGLESVCYSSKEYFNIFQEYKYERYAKYTLPKDHCLVLNHKPVLYKLPESISYWNKKGREQEDEKEKEIKLLT